MRLTVHPRTTCNSRVAAALRNGPPGTAERLLYAPSVSVQPSPARQACHAIRVSALPRVIAAATASIVASMRPALTLRASFADTRRENQSQYPAAKMIRACSSSSKFPALNRRSSAVGILSGCPAERWTTQTSSSGWIRRRTRKGSKPTTS
jgi:hypothetical protein